MHILFMLAVKSCVLYNVWICVLFPAPKVCLLSDLNDNYFSIYQYGSLVSKW